MPREPKSKSSRKPFAVWKRELQQAGLWQERSAKTVAKRLPRASSVKQHVDPPRRVREFRCPHCRKKAVV